MAELNEIVLPDGTTRRMGNVEPPQGLARAWPVYGDTRKAPLLPRVEWKDRCDAIGLGHESPFLSEPHDQDGIGMCNPSATVGAMEAQRAKQGLPHVALSGGDLYKRIHVGRGDNGSLLEDSLAESMTGGVAPVSVVPYLDWRGDRPGAEEARKRFRVLEAYLCPTFDHCFSAVLCGFDLISGIMWYDNYTPDRDGWLPLRPSGRPGGHAVHGYKPTHRNGVFGIWHQNSWSRKWGLNGRCVFPESAYGRQIGGWWAVRAVTDEGGDVPAPKVA